MKKRKWLVIMCLFLTFVLSACGKDADITEEAISEMTEEALNVETEASEEAKEAVEAQVPEEYAMAVIVTINPQVKLYLDADNVIIGVEYLNEDARTAFSDIDFSNVTVEEGMGKIIEAAVEKEFLTDGKEISIDVAEIRDAGCDSEAVCAEVETAVIKAVEDNHVTAAVTAQVSAEPTSSESSEAVVPETTPEPSEPVTQEEASNPSETPVEEATPEPLEQVVQEATPEPTEEPAPADPCSNCGGTGKCDECKGDGYRGAGYTVSCPRCHGSLTETCIYCDANGNSTKHEGKCDFPNCMGAHVYACTTCGGGTQPVTCASCNGSGKCKVCGGSGTK
ncbi:MAG: hypothetical protein ACI4TB_08155 [Lachnospiraceae bacterium]